MALPLIWVVGNIDWTGTTLPIYSKALILAGLIVLGLILYLALSYLLRSPEWPIVEEFRRALKSRLYRALT
jgi:hypothetical protein